MKTTKAITGLLFFIILTVHCLFIYRNATVDLLTKLCLTPLLIIYLAGHKGKVSLLVISALVFSFLGDLLLEFSVDLAFLLGMLAFVGAHVCNSIFFSTLQGTEVGKGRATLVAIGITVCFSVFVYRQIEAQVGNFRLPVIFYMFVISLMAVLAAGTLQISAIRNIAIRYWMPGVAFFMFSDAILAINKFVWNSNLPGAIVMATYGIAQFLLVSGFGRLQENTAQKPLAA
jgi:uncharacterized membrane protein YhhN